MDAVGSEAVEPALRRLVELMDPLPAWVMTRWWDVLACNESYRDLTGDLQAGLPGIARNICRQSFTTRAIQQIYADWHAVAGWFVADLRLSAATWPSDPHGTGLVAELRSTSRHFARLWDGPEPLAAERRIAFVHPAVGRLELDLVRLARPESSRQYVVALVPPDAATAGVLERLSGGIRAGIRAGVRART